MASKDYDDLLESFMNNSKKVYNEDKDAHSGANKNLPTSYDVYKGNDGKSNKEKRNNKKSNNNKGNNNRPVKEKTPSQKVFSTIGKVILGFILVCFVVGIVCGSVASVYGYSVVHGDAVFNLDDEKYGQNQTSFIYGYDNKKNTVEITRLHGEENRIWLDSKDMTKYMSQAFIAIEDERFNKHHGVDWKRTIGVTVKMNGQGGSTITQQLIKNLTDENDATFVRKFNEILSALNIEKHYSKDEIIEAYLNTVYLSHGCYGVKTAAETYFGKDVSDLNIAECACLASITKAPSTYDPLMNPDQNRTRQLYVMQKMYEEKMITKQEYDDAVNYKMVFTNSKDYKGSQIKKTTEKKDKSAINSYYTDFVINEVTEDLQKMGYSSKKAKNMIYGGGLKIYSAVDFDVQNAIEDVYENYRRMPDETVQGACVVMNYEGRIMGIVGGTGKKTVNLGLNRASMSKRQPGSTIKPLSVYGPALQKTADDGETNVYWSTPTKDAPLMKIDGKWWPTNEGGGFSSNNVTVQKGLANSMNTISAQTLDKIGPDYSFDFITNKFHISTLDSVIDCDLAPMATGALTYGATVLDMTAAYATFGNGGNYYEPYSYYKIEDSQGNTLIEKDPAGSKETALSEGTAWVMNKMLQTVMTQGTGTTYKLNSIECFGKTGTTTDDKDRWFMGGTPEYVGGVWYGYDKPKEVYYNLSPNPSGTLWNLVMKNIYEQKGVNENKFDVPDDTISQKEYCSTCGKLRSGTGNWGWFDNNNLPGYCSGGHAGSVETTTKSDGSKTTTSNGNGQTNDGSNTTNSTNNDSQQTTKSNENQQTTSSEKPSKNGEDNQ